MNIQLLNGEPLHGVIKWIGSLPEFPDVVAGIELVSFPLLHIVNE